jgi:dynein heavy chain, axonemal
MWCRAIDKFARVNKEVEPKKKKVEEMTKMLEQKNRELERKQKELVEARDRVGKLERDVEQTIQNRNKIIFDMEKTNKRLNNAGLLTTLLGDEEIRWRQFIKDINHQLEHITGDIFLAAVTVSYLGAFTGNYRDAMILKWLELLKSLEIPLTDKYSLSETLSNGIIIREWNLSGLPYDQVSIDNAVIGTRAERWPLFIDPQNVANIWIKAQWKNERLKVNRAKKKRNFLI